MTFPDLPYMPELPHGRTETMTVDGILNQSRAALHAAWDALHDLVHGDGIARYLPDIRQIVIECRRSTLVLQKLSTRVEGWEDWYAPRRAAMKGDPLLRYFVDLRNQIEKEGLPMPLAEVYDLLTRETVAVVAVGEDQFGVWVSGEARPSGGEPLKPGIYDREQFGLRNFRLPDPPSEHNGEELTDLRFASLAELVISYLGGKVIQPAIEQFGINRPHDDSAEA